MGTWGWRSGVEVGVLGVGCWAREGWQVQGVDAVVLI